MPQDPRQGQRNAFQMSSEEYRRVQAARAEKRRKRQRQRLLVLGAFVLAAIILIVCIVLVIRSLFKKDDDATSGVDPTSSVTETDGETVNTATYPTASDPSVWNLTLVNENNPLPSTYAMTEEELGNIPVDQVAYYFDARIIESLQQMINDCNTNEGYSLTINSGYRSIERQEKNFSYQVSLGAAEEDVKRYESTAGASDHHTGLAVDFITNNVKDNTEAFATTPEYQWLVQNAENYGFVLRYPGEKAAITGMDYQPYHWRYVGVEDAKVMNAAGICLEEYVSAVSPGASAPAADDPDPNAEGDGNEGEGGDDNADGDGNEE